MWGPWPDGIGWGGAVGLHYVLYCEGPLAGSVAWGLGPWPLLAHPYNGPGNGTVPVQNTTPIPTRRPVRPHDPDHMFVLRSFAIKSKSKPESTSRTSSVTYVLSKAILSPWERPLNNWHSL